jgi:putative Mg2+ transporter-C (MgtC) family protein
MIFDFPLWQEFAAGLPSGVEAARIAVRLLCAVMLGGILGFERRHVGKPAGMRTHMLVALGSALVVLVAQLTEMSSDGLSRVIQGALTGIGFIGGGVILKLSEEHQIVGVTTAASIWLTATVGIAAGTGRLGLAVVGTVLALVILSVFWRLEHWMMDKTKSPGDSKS